MKWVEDPKRTVSPGFADTKKPDGVREIKTCRQQARPSFLFPCGLPPEVARLREAGLCVDHPVQDSTRIGRVCSQWRTRQARNGCPSRPDLDCERHTVKSVHLQGARKNGVWNIEGVDSCAFGLNPPEAPLFSGTRHPVSSL